MIAMLMAAGAAFVVTVFFTPLLIRRFRRRWVYVGGVCLLIALLGNVMGKVRRNFFVGIRTPWTIANEQVWNATHRFAAKTFFAGGLLGLIAVVFRAPFWLPVTAIMVAAVVPVIYSLMLYKRLEHRGELN